MRVGCGVGGGTSEISRRCLGGGDGISLYMGNGDRPSNLWQIASVASRRYSYLAPSNLQPTPFDLILA